LPTLSHRGEAKREGEGGDCRRAEFLYCTASGAARGKEILRKKKKGREKKKEIQRATNNSIFIGERRTKGRGRKGAKKKKEKKRGRIPRPTVSYPRLHPKKGGKRGVGKRRADVATFFPFFFSRPTALKGKGRKRRRKEYDPWSSPLFPSAMLPEGKKKKRETPWGVEREEGKAGRHSILPSQLGGSVGQTPQRKERKEKKEEKEERNR